MLTPQAIACQLQVSEYRNYAAHGGVQAPSPIRVGRIRIASRCGVGRRGDRYQYVPYAPPRGSGRLRERKGHAAGGSSPAHPTAPNCPRHAPRVRSAWPAPRWCLLPVPFPLDPFKRRVERKLHGGGKASGESTCRSGVSVTQEALRQRSPSESASFPVTSDCSPH